MIKIADYAELYLISWYVDRDNLSISEKEAFAQYQANWRYVHVQKMDEREWLLLLRLVEEYGPIVIKFRRLELGEIGTDYLRELRSGKFYTRLSDWED